MAVMPYLVEAGFQITAAAPPDGPLANELRQLGLATVDLELRDEAGVRMSADIIHNHIVEIVDRVQPDLIHANSLAMGRLTGPVVKSTGVPGVCHLRDIVRVSRAAVEHLNAHDRLFVVSRAALAWHLKEGLDPVRSYLLYNGIDTDKFRPRTATGALHRELGIDRDALLVGTIGQLGMRKGPDVLLRGVARLVESHPLLHLIMIGTRQSNKEESRQLESDLREAAQSSPLLGKVHFLGRREDIADVLPEFTLLAHPARQEPLGRVLLEAAATGLPIVATDVGGTSEIFPPEENLAWLLPPDDSDALASALDTLLQSPERCREMGQAARTRVESHFTAATSAEALLGQYRQILAPATD